MPADQRDFPQRNTEQDERFGRPTNPCLTVSSEATDQSEELDAESPNRFQELRDWANSANFAISCGIVGPIVCLLLDPIVFRGGDENGPMIGESWVLAYTFIWLEIAAFAAWIARRGQFGVCSGVAAGILFGGAFVASGVGLLLLPISVIGAFALIGFLGFTPWLTAYAFLRQSMLAMAAARARTGLTRGLVGMLLGLLFAFGVPAMAQISVNRAWRGALQAVVSGDVSARSRVKFWHWFVEMGSQNDPLDRAIEDEQDPIRKERLIQARN